MASTHTEFPLTTPRLLSLLAHIMANKGKGRASAAPKPAKPESARARKAREKKEQEEAAEKKRIEIERAEISKITVANPPGGSRHNHGDSEFYRKTGH